jgi:hypothetical protein
MPKFWGERPAKPPVKIRTKKCQHGVSQKTLRIIDRKARMITEMSQKKKPKNSSPTKAQHPGHRKPEFSTKDEMLSSQRTPA